MKLSLKQRRNIVMFVIATAIGLINNPLGIVLDVCFLIWQLMEEDDE
ncbi:hypothetical protein [Coleofasciculus sp. FACHB-1120]|nr:hypothetical protein [Coleofasciculus sp. FACHB-1120]MBD2743623.1 hypothetical protein [Coleofasciculus sp. FACHB-1120]